MAAVAVTGHRDWRHAGRVEKQSTVTGTVTGTPPAAGPPGRRRVEEQQREIGAAGPARLHHVTLASS